MTLTDSTTHAIQKVKGTEGYAKCATCIIVQWRVQRHQQWCQEAYPAGMQCIVDGALCATLML